jgi:Xaa-Pro dipeptidase
MPMSVFSSDISGDSRPVAFDRHHLDELMGEASLDAILVTSAANQRYLLGGYRFFLYDRQEAVGRSRYTPIVGYLRERPDMAFHVGWSNEQRGLAEDPIWVPLATTDVWTAHDAGKRAGTLLKARVREHRRIGYESAFLGHDAYTALRLELGSHEFVDATALLDELRAVKSAHEISLLSAAAHGVVESMLDVFGSLETSHAELDVVNQLRCRQAERGLDFQYCLTLRTSTAVRRSENPAARSNLT